MLQILLVISLVWNNIYIVLAAQWLNLALPICLLTILHLFILKSPAAYKEKHFCS